MDRFNLPDYVEVIPLNKFSKKREIKLYAFVDSPTFLQYQHQNFRSARGDTYAATTIEGQSVYLHHLVLPSMNGFFVDHISRNTFDNRDENLRYVNHQQSIWNTGPRNGRQYKGTSKIGNKFRAIIKTDKQTHLGMFDTEEEAAFAYDKAAFQFAPEYTYLNFEHRFNRMTGEIK